MITLKFLILVGVVLIAYTLGWFLTERVRLASLPLFDFEAFRCRKCLSFHISWVLSTAIALLFPDFIMMGVGFVFAGFLFLGLYLDEKIKIEKGNKILNEAFRDMKEKNPNNNMFNKK